MRSLRGPRRGRHRLHRVGPDMRLCLPGAGADSPNATGDLAEQLGSRRDNALLRHQCAGSLVSTCADATAACESQFLADREHPHLVVGDGMWQWQTAERQPTATDDDEWPPGACLQHRDGWTL